LLVKSVKIAERKSSPQRKYRDFDLLTIIVTTLVVTSFDLIAGKLNIHLRMLAVIKV